jgi:tripartite-type tricarboxylate transporter receptor subunit TctC
MGRSGAILHCDIVRRALFRRTLALAFATIALSDVGADAQAQSVEAFYQGKQITLLINSGAGGGYDVYARVFARTLPKHIPGNPVVVPKNLPGAAGLLAANTLYANSDQQGLTIAALANTAGLDPLMETQGARFDARKLNWIGSIGKVSNVCATWFDSPIKTVSDLKDREVVVAGAAAGSNSVVVPYMLNLLLGTRFKIISGYEPGKGMELAVENREVDGICGLSWSTLKASRPDWIINKRLNVILQMSMVPLTDLPGVPSVLDLVADPEQRRILQFILIRQETGRPFATSPNVPPDRVEALRKAFMDTLKDPEFIADAERASLEIDPLSGEQIDKMLADAYAQPAAVVQKAKDIIERATNGR